LVFGEIFPLSLTSNKTSFFAHVECCLLIDAIWHAHQDKSSHILRAAAATTPVTNPYSISTYALIKKNVSSEWAWGPFDFIRRSALNKYGYLGAKSRGR
jgi:hypothetical protein